MGWIVGTTRDTCVMSLGRSRRPAGPDSASKVVRAVADRRRRARVRQRRSALLFARQQRASGRRCAARRDDARRRPQFGVERAYTRAAAHSEWYSAPCRRRSCRALNAARAVSAAAQPKKAIGVGAFHRARIRAACRATASGTRTGCEEGGARRIPAACAISATSTSAAPASTSAACRLISAGATDRVQSQIGRKHVAERELKRRRCRLTAVSACAGSGARPFRRAARRAVARRRSVRRDKAVPSRHRRLDAKQHWLAGAVAALASCSQRQLRVRRHPARQLRAAVRASTTRAAASLGSTKSLASIRPESAGQAPGLIRTVV
jgi:hypothetical protein